MTLTPQQNDLVLENLEYAQDIAKQLAWKLPFAATELQIDRDDMIQLATTGLIQAAQKFQPGEYTDSTLQKHFKSYAYPRIRGAIYDECRRQAFVGRSGLDNGDKEKIQMLSLDYQYDNDYTLELVDNSGARDDIIDFIEGLKVLTDREKKVLLSLMVGMTQSEISADLGVTESRVSQIASRARTKIKEVMTWN